VIFVTWTRRRLVMVIDPERSTEGI
jgi:hypothetical protein